MNKYGMIFFWICFSFMGIPILVYPSQNTFSETERLNRLYWNAMALVAPEQVPDSIRERKRVPIKCHFGLLHQVRLNFDRFSFSQQSALYKIMERPDLPYHHITSDGLFKIHYTLDGEDRVSYTDENANGIPDYVEEAAKALQSAYQVIIRDLGFRPPPSDRTDGPEWDVYIHNIRDAYGWTNIEKRVSFSPVTWTSYIEVDNDYTHTYTKGINGLRVTIAHEFFHMVQLGYNGRDNDNDNSFDDLFLMEASSTYMEDVVYDEINDYYNYLDGLFYFTNTRFDEANGWREYGLSLWFHFLEKHLGTRDILREIWENLCQEEAFPAMNVALRNHFTTFSDVLGLFYAWNWMTGTRADTNLYYPEGNAYPEMNPDAQFTFRRDTTITADVVNTGVRYYSVEGSDGQTCTFIFSNVDWISHSSNFASFQLYLSGFPLGSYVPVSEDLYAWFSSVNLRNWRNYVANTYSNSQTTLSSFASPDDTSTEKGMPFVIPNPYVLSKHRLVYFPFFLETSGPVRIRIFTPSGYLIYEEAQEFSSGAQRYGWNGKNNHGEFVARGIYFYTITQGSALIRMGKFGVVR